jgi:glycosyltransferase involved in cell wall biosynthesis
LRHWDLPAKTTVWDLYKKTHQQLSMFFYKNPTWIDKRLLAAGRLEDLPESIYYEINKNLGTIQSEDPLISVVIPAYNEELNIVRTIHSLSQSKTTLGIEIIVVNNNSTDRTQAVLSRLNVRSYFQSKPGCGPARQMGQQHAKGKYILTADADCYYPPRWIEKMTKALQQENVTCVYGRYSFLATADKPRWKLFWYETVRDIVGELRHINRPCINALGMSMGYVKDLGLKVGFVDRKVRGEDGRMCFQLMHLGKIKQVRDRSVRVWTLPRTLEKEPSLIYSLMARAAVELSRIKHYFYPQAPHDVNKTGHYTPQTLKYFKRYKQVHKKEVLEADEEN